MSDFDDEIFQQTEREIGLLILFSEILVGSSSTCHGITVIDCLTFLDTSMQALASREDVISFVKFYSVQPEMLKSIIKNALLFNQNQTSDLSRLRQLIFQFIQSLESDNDDEQEFDDAVDISFNNQKYVTQSIDTKWWENISLKSPLENVECNVCFDTFTEQSQVPKLECNHNFHKECLSVWFKTNSTCPCCRFQFPKEKSFEEEDLTSESEGVSDDESPHLFSVNIDELD